MRQILSNKDIDIRVFIVVVNLRHDLILQFEISKNPKGRAGPLGELGKELTKNTSSTI